MSDAVVQQGSSRSSVRSGPSGQEIDEGVRMDMSVCRKRKDHPEIGRSHSVGNLPGRSNRKVFSPAGTSW